MTHCSEIRLIADGSHQGVTNMARDEALLESVGRGQSPPTLRFYQWSEPTVSLGYFQRFEDWQQIAPPAGCLPVVRRTTGGGAILHDLELTYAFVIPTDHSLLRERHPTDLYDIVHQAFTCVLAELSIKPQHPDADIHHRAQRGPFFCFERRSQYDILLDQKKLMGSAQRRKHGCILQHGSLILASRYDQQPCATLNSIADIAPAELIARVVAAMPDDISFVEGSYNDFEVSQAPALEEKYASREWTQRR